MTPETLLRSNETLSNAAVEQQKISRIGALLRSIKERCASICRRAPPSTKRLRYATLYIDQLEERRVLSAGSFLSDFTDESDSTAYVAQLAPDTLEQNVYTYNCEANLSSGDADSESSSLTAENVDAVFALYGDEETSLIDQTESPYQEHIEEALDPLATPEAQVTYFSQKKAEQEGIVADLEKELSAIESELSEVTQRIDELTREIRDYTEVEPSFRVEARIYTNYVDITFSDMPQGTRAELWKDGYVIDSVATTGNGTTSFTISTGAWADFAVGFRDGNGTVMGDTAGFRAFRNTIREIPDSTEHELENYAYTKTLTPDEQIILQGMESEQQSMSTREEELETQKTPLSAELGQERVVLATIAHDLQEAIRDTIPYARMFVDAVLGSDIHIHFRSQDNKVFFHLRVTDDSGYGALHSVEDAGGHPDSHTIFSLPNDRLGGSGAYGGRGMVYVLEMLDDKRQLIDAITLNNSGHIYTDQIPWEHLDAGKMNEHPIQPELSVVMVQGNNLLLSVDNPGDTSVVILEGGGLLSEEALTHQGGTDSRFVNLTFKADNPTGEYKASLYNISFGAELATVTFQWNNTTKSISGIDNAELWTALRDTAENPELAVTAVDTIGAAAVKTLSAEIEAIVRENEIAIAFQKQAALSTLSTSFLNLTAYQREHIYENSLLGVDQSFLIQKFNEKYPDKSVFNDYKHEQQTLNGYTDFFNSYVAELGRILERAVDMFTQIRHGAAERPLIDALRADAERTAVLPHIGNLRELGIVFPSYDEIETEGKRLSFAMVDELIANQQMNREFLRQDALSAENRGWQLENDQPDLSNLSRLTVSEERRLARAERLVRVALEQSNDPRPLLVVSAADAPNIQQIRAEAAANGQIAVTEPELKAAAETVDETLDEYGDDPEKLPGKLGKKLSQVLNSIEYVEGGVDRATSENTMIVVIYGSNQFPGEGIGAGRGFDLLSGELLEDYTHVLAISPGVNPSNPEYFDPNGRTPTYAFEELKSLVTFTKVQNPEITNVVIVGYSWGGGSTYALADWLTNQSGLGLRITGTVYVDAVQSPVSGALLINQAETRLPPGTNAMLNIYQSDVNTIEDPFNINGNVISNSNGFEDIQQIDLDTTGLPQNHDTIDDDLFVHYKISSFINRKVSTKD